MGIGPLFSLLDANNPATLDDLWDTLIVTAPDLATKLGYGEIFELNHVSPNIIGARANGTSTPLMSITINASDPQPTFHWEIPDGYSTNAAVPGPPLLNRFWNSPQKVGA